MADKKNVVVIGGGVVGMTSALYLHQAGHTVTVLEKKPTVGDGASYGNNALLTPSLTGPLASPDLPKTLFKYLGDEHSPFAFSLTALPAMSVWGLRFLANCRQQPWQQATRTLLELSLHSQRLLKQATDQFQLEYDRASLGTLRVFRDKQAFEAARAGTQTLSDLGINCQVLNTQACVDLESRLAGSEVDLKGGIYTPDDESGDSHRYVMNLTAELQQQGVEIRCSTEVTGLVERAGKVTAVKTTQGLVDADLVVLCTAFVPPQLAKLSALRPLSINPVKGYSFTVQLEEGQSALGVPVIEDKRKIGVTPLGQRLRVAARAEFRGFDDHRDTQVLERMHGYFRELFPCYAEADVVDQWCGFRPVTTSSIPYIGNTALPGLFVNLGHGHLGWTLANGSARLLTDLINGQPPLVDPAPFSINRTR